MTTLISRISFLIPAASLICYLAVRFTQPTGPTIDYWISQPEIKNCLICIGNEDWVQAGLHFSRALTAEGYLLAALFFLALLGMKLSFNRSGKDELAYDSEAEARESEANRLGNMGLACSDSGQIEKAIGYYEQALTAAYQTHDQHIYGTTLGNLGNAYQTLGEVEKAVRYHKQALVIFQKIGDRQGEGSVLANLGKTYSACGQVEIAIKYNKQSLMIFEEIYSPHAIPLRRWLSELENKGNRGGG